MDLNSSSNPWLPVFTVAGPALWALLPLPLLGLAPFYSNMAVSPDWGLGFLLGIGGIAGMYCGARVQKYVPAKAIKWILVICVLFIASKYLLEV